MDTKTAVNWLRQTAKPLLEAQQISDFPWSFSQSLDDVAKVIEEAGAKTS
jgi:hypothetical protein